MAKEKKEAEMIDLHEKVTIIGKGSKHLKEGVEYEVAKKVAEHLVEKGVAVYPKNK